jgi:hypothetical protein
MRKVTVPTFTADAQELSSFWLHQPAIAKNNYARTNNETGNLMNNLHKAWCALRYQARLHC